MGESFKVVGIKTQNLRRIELVELSFDGKGWLEINGSNGAGKSTLLDAIYLALVGPRTLTRRHGKDFQAWRVIKLDADKAIVKVTLKSEERTVEVRRSITAKDDEGSGSYLSVTDQDGKRLTQDFLDRLLNEVALDPTSVAALRPKEQADLMRDMAGIDEAAFERRRTAARERRRVANADAKRLEAQTQVEPAKVEPVSVDDLVKQQRALKAENDAIDGRNREREKADDAVADAEANVEFTQGEIKRLEDLLRAQKDLLEKRQAALKLIADTRAKLGATESRKLTDVVDQAIADAAKTNAAADRRKEWEQRTAELAQARKAAADAQGELDKVDCDRAQALQDAKLPFTNLDFNDDVGILVDGIPLSQKSSGEQLRIGVRLAMQMESALRLIVVRDGTTLDPESYDLLRELAEKHGYQVIVERVGEREGEDRIVMRAGRAISVFEPQETTAAKARKMGDRL